jgi:hypothetical protein
MINPEYIAAHIELRVQRENGDMVNDPYPMKFRDDDVPEALRMLEAHDIGGLHRLSIPIEISAVSL